MAGDGCGSGVFFGIHVRQVGLVGQSVHVSKGERASLRASLRIDSSLYGRVFFFARGFSLPFLLRVR